MKPTPLSTTGSIRLLKPFFAERRGTIAIGLFCLALVDLLQLLIPRVIKSAVDDLALRADPRNLPRQALAVVGLALLIGFFRYIWRRCLIGTSRRVEEGLRLRLFTHLQTLSAPFFDTARTGDLMAHATNDVQSVRMAAGMGLVALTDALVLGVATVAFMAAIQPRLTALVLIPMPFIAFGTRFFSRRMHQRYGAVQQAFSELTETVRERVAGMRVIKAFDGEAHSLAAVEAASERNLAENMRLVRITGSFFPMMVLFSNISLALVLFFGGRQAIRGEITPGEFVAFISYLGLLTWPMMAMGWVTNLIQRGKASLDRLQAILATRPEVVESSEARPLKELRAGLRFEAVTFAFPARETETARPVLEQIDLDLSRGEVLGIAGPPGGGKSTLLALIPRLYDVNAGRILLDGTDLRLISLSDLRQLVAFVPQEPFLFSGSVRENILMGRPQAGSSALEAAVDAAALEDTLARFPRGLDTVVGERGVILSGGQKQRIALARAFLSDAPILVLDDPVSQVDAETAARIIAGLHRLAGKRTMAIVSHRLSALRFADRILVIEEGRVSEAGTHARLVQTDGYYSRAFRLQEIEDAYGADTAVTRDASVNSPLSAGLVIENERPE